ncbi:glycosyltransferase [Sodalis sp. RH16]|uniref:glycosyltransferase n=1 Tax=Sodalis sp. RH16 TaxID=3394331 RepID=UPI0039B48D6B
MNQYWLFDGHHFKDKIFEACPPYHIQSAIARENVKTRYANLPAASDILRYYLLKTFGGLYMDVYVVLKEPLGDLVSQSDNKDYKADFLFHFMYIIKNNEVYSLLNNDFLASVKDSVFINKMLDEAIYPYLETTHNPNSGMFNNTASIIKLMEDFKEVAVPETKNSILSDESNENYEFINAMWHGKRATGNARFSLTLNNTGPELLEKVIFENSRDTLILMLPFIMKTDWMTMSF